MTRTPMQLDEPSSTSRRAAAAWLTLGGLYILLALIVSQLPQDPLLAVPGVALAHSLAMGVVGLVTAILLFANASRAGNVGYLVLAGTFACVVVLGLALPLAFPGAILTADDGSPERVLGGVQSSITLFYLWHLVLYVGLPVSALFFAHSARRPRVRLSPMQIAGSVVVSVAVGLLLVAWDLLTPDTLPVLIEDGNIDLLAQVLDWVLLAISVSGLVLIVVVTRERSVISRWITAVAVLCVGEAIVNVGVERYSAGWYFTRTFGLVAMSALLLALVWETARVDRAALTVASHDTLTSARSRALFETDLAREVARSISSSEPLALLWIDIDDFKAVNDRFGHSSGDLVLKEITQRILADIRNTDLLARMGGDEFAVALPGVGSRKVAEAVADRIVSDLAVPIEVGPDRVFTSCSVGLAFVPEDAQAADELSHKADIAMYEAKSTGGSRYVSYRDGLEQQARESAELRSSLLGALESRGFEPYAQPIVDLPAQNTVGFEILARWRRSGQVVNAADFIEQAESSGIILPIGQQVREATLESLPQLFRAHPGLDYVAINLSVRELSDPSTVDVLSGPLWRFWAGKVMIELTESAALHASGAAALAIDALRQVGYRVAVDDFGVGYSTMVRLEQLQPEVIKTDRSLLTRIHERGSAPQAMLRWANEIARALDSRLVVEGVETAEEDAIVRSMEGAMAQGYFYGEPAPLDSWFQPLSDG